MMEIQKGTAVVTQRLIAMFRISSRFLVESMIFAMVNVVGHLKPCVMCHFLAIWLLRAAAMWVFPLFITKVCFGVVGMLTKMQEKAAQRGSDDFYKICR
jgi:hypothetical protein